MVSSHTSIQFRYAAIEDLTSLVRLLAEDELGKDRENLDVTSSAKYEAAFRQIIAQQGNQILLATQAGEVIAMLQLMFIPGLSHQGATRAQIESVRVKSNTRGKGVGRLLFKKAIELSQQAGCDLVQLTTDRRREDAILFYESLGFKPTHYGMKLPI